METVFSTRGLPPEEAAAYWLDHGTSAYCPHIADLVVAGTVLQPETFFVEGGLAPIGDVAITTLEMESSRIERGRRHIGRGGKDVIYVVAALQGSFSFSQHGRTVIVRPGDLYLEDTRYPFELTFPSRAKAMGLAVPAEMMIRRVGPVDRFSGALVPHDDPIGTMTLKHLLALAATDTSRLITPDSWRLRDIALDLSAMALSQITQETPRLHAHGDTARTRLTQAMLDQLDQPDTTVASIARQAAMSTRYAGVLMAEVGTTVGRRLREMRIDRAKSRLADPAYDAARVIDVAIQCGFADPSTFARRFRESEGMSPTEYRLKARAERAANDTSQALNA